MSTIIVWLLITATNSSISTLGQFPSEATCQEAREQGIKKLPLFYRVHTECVRATVVKGQP